MRALLTALFLLANPATAAECTGQNVFDTMAPDVRMAIEAAARAVPYPEGNLWTATKEGQTVTLVGTYHFDDPRHDQTMALIAPLIDSAATVLVEAGPEEEKALIAHMARDPSLMILPDTTLPELLPAADWDLLAKALSRRGIPPFMAAKFQPWYVTLLLAVPNCGPALAQKPRGLDARILERATASNLPVRALEPYDTVFRIFDLVPAEDQFAMIRNSLATEDRAQDYAVTLADTYFAGHSRLIWELMRAEALTLPGADPTQTAREFEAMEEALMSSRNRAWIPVIETASQSGPVFAAFGALHLPGADGVLNLLDRAGWALEPLTMPRQTAP